MTTAGLLTCGLSSLLSSPWGAFMGIRRGTFMPQGCGLDVSSTVHHSLAPTVQVALAYLASLSYSGPLPRSLLLEGPGSGVVLGPSPWAEVTEFAWVESAVSPESPGFQGEFSQQHHPGGVRTKAIKTSTAQGMQHFSCTGFQDDPPWPFPKSSGWGTSGTDVPA